MSAGTGGNGAPAPRRQFREPALSEVEGASRPRRGRSCIHDDLVSWTAGEGARRTAGKVPALHVKALVWCPGNSRHKFSVSS